MLIDNVHGGSMDVMTTLIDVPPGLNGVAVTDTSIGDVDGDAGYFHYRGHDATELARHHGFEEAWHLVAVGHLPDAVELAAFRSAVAAERVLPSSLLPVLEPLARATGATLGRVRAAVSIAADELGLRPLIDIDADERAAQAPARRRRDPGRSSPHCTGPASASSPSTPPAAGRSATPPTTSASSPARSRRPRRPGRSSST